MIDPARQPSAQTQAVGGWRCMLGSTPQALSIFRIGLGSLLIIELFLRFRFLHVFYTDEGTMPLHLLLPKIDGLYQLVCIHCHFGELWQQQILLAIQVAFAVFFTVGYETRLSSIISWYMYSSLILRNTWLYFILDRYFFYLLFYSMFLPPMDECWSIQAYWNNNKKESPKKDAVAKITVSPATIALKLLVLWIYLDAGSGKYRDPFKGWTYGAQPLPALDTYCRHTLMARYIYAILGPTGLRLLTPTVVWIELLAAPITIISSWLGNARITYIAIGVISSLHFGISLTIRNSVLLSDVAIVAWAVFLPVGWKSDGIRKNDDNKSGATATASASGPWYNISTLIIVAMIVANIWFETIGDCSSGQKRNIFGTLLQNRWNVFIGAEEYVTWEIAPGRLADGSIVDVWGRSDVVEWSMPGTGAPCTSTSRPGRWRSFPYLAELDGEDGHVLWEYLCQQWDSENQVHDAHNPKPGRELLRFNFFMLQADVLPNMGFSSTRKRLIHSHECGKSWQQRMMEEELAEKEEILQTGTGQLNMPASETIPADASSTSSGEL